MKTECNIFFLCVRAGGCSFMRVSSRHTRKSRSFTACGKGRGGQKGNMHRCMDSASNVGAIRNSGPEVDRRGIVADVMDMKVAKGLVEDRTA